MFQLDIQKFLKEGYLFNLDEIEKEDITYSKLGAPDDIEDYGDKGKYLHFDNLRLQFLNDKLVGTSVFFMNSDNAYEVLIEEEVFKIEKSMCLTTMLLMLNRLNLKWAIPYEQSRFDYLLIEIQSGVKIYYYLENNCLERITKSYI